MSNSASLFPDRIARLPFLRRYFVLIIATFVANVLLQLGSDAANSVVRLSLALAALAFLLFILVCLFRSILFPRLRDIGLHTAYSLIVLVPLINFLFLIALLFVPTDSFTRSTGNSA